MMDFALNNSESLIRVIGVLILAYFANRFRIKKLNWTEQLIMMYGGLRGGVAFALVLLLEESFAPNAKMFVTTTLAMVYWTVFVQVISKERCLLPRYMTVISRALQSSLLSSTSESRKRRMLWSPSMRGSQID